jgi:hypothetical protein
MGCTAPTGTLALPSTRETILSCNLPELNVLLSRLLSALRDVREAVASICAAQHVSLLLLECTLHCRGHTMGCESTGMTYTSIKWLVTGWTGIALLSTAAGHRVAGVQCATQQQERRVVPASDSSFSLSACLMA